MAKNYSAKLSLKDAGMLTTLKKAIAETAKLKKNLQQLSKTPVKIEAKVGSSFKNVQAQINKVAPKSKTINFTAKENITRTISQVERSVFEMNKNIATSMTGITSSINGAMGSMGNLASMPARFGNITNAMNALNTASNMSTIGSGMQGVLPGVLGAGAGAGIVAAATRTGNQVQAALVGNKGARIKADRQWVKTWTDRIGSVKKLMPKLGGVMEDALNSISKKLPNPWKQNDLGRDNDTNMFKPLNNFEAMIDRQMTKLEKLDKKMRSLGVNRSSNLSVGGYTPMSAVRNSTTGASEDFLTRTDDSMTNHRNFEAIKAQFAKIPTYAANAFAKVERIMIRAITDPIGLMKSTFNKLKAIAIAPFQKMREYASGTFTIIKGIATNTFNSIKDTGVNAFNRVRNTGTNAMNRIKQSVIGISAGILRLPAFMQRSAQAMLSSIIGFVQGSNRLVQSIGRNLNRVWTGAQIVAHRAWYSIERAAYKSTYAMVTGVLRVSRAFAMFGVNAKGTWRLLKVGATKTFEQISRSGMSTMQRLTMYIGRSFSQVFGTVGRGFRRMFTKTVRDSDGTTRTIQRGWVTMASSIARTIGSSIGGALNKLKSIGLSVAKGIGAAFTGALAIGIKGMADRERNLISMRHFLKVGDAKKNGKRTKDDGQINKEADNYMGDLTDFANATPFDTFEVYNAGRRGLQISDGDSKKALDVTKLAGDMAALNPQKTITDAMEALADLKIGQNVRMKEFGFKFSQDDFKKILGKEPGGETLTADELEEAFTILTSEGGEVYKTFTGGAEDLSHSLSGKWSTLWGKFKGMMADAMLPFQDMFKGILDKGVLLIDSYTPQFVAGFAVAKNFIVDLMKGDGSNFPIIDNLLASGKALGKGLAPIGESVMGAFEGMSNSLNDGFGGVGGLIQSVSETIGDALGHLAPVFTVIGTICEGVMDIVASVWPTIQDIISVAAQIIGEALIILDPIIAAVGDVCVAIGNIIAQVWPSIKDTIFQAWEIIRPVFEVFKDLVVSIANFIRDNWPAIATIIEAMWEVASIPLNLMLGVFEGISNAIQWAWDKAKGFSEWWNTTKWNPVNLFSGNSTPQGKAENKKNSAANSAAMNQGRGSHATGLDRVPRNNYLATLHEGERVLTARESRQADASKNTASSTGNTFNITVTGGSSNEETARILVAELKKTFNNMNLNPA